MSAFEVPSVSEPSFALHAALDAARVNVRLSGSADGRTIDSLESFVDRLHHETLRAGVAEVVVELLHLEFMNS